MKRIWFKPDCVEWIKQGKKTTTWRTRKHEGEYEVVKGSWFNNKPIGLKLRLTPIVDMSFGKLLTNYETEGDFANKEVFFDWLVNNGLSCDNQKKGWLHKIEVV